MNRRDVVMLLMILVYGVFIARDVINIENPEDILTHFTIGLIILAVSLWVFMLAGVFIPQLGKWGDKKIFKKNNN